MFFRQLATKEASLSYFFGCIGHRKAIAVDVVAGDEQWFVDQAKAMDVEIAHVVDTHVHADHYCAAATSRGSWPALSLDKGRFIAAVTGSVPARPADMAAIVAANTSA